MLPTTQPYFLTPYIAAAYRNADIAEATWQPELGFRANRAILEKLYVYYQQLYAQAPQQFLWAGLARMTGGQVLFGMDNLCKMAHDPCVLTQNIVAVAKTIFERMAWQHELFLNDYDLLLQLCAKLNTTDKTAHNYADCWQLVATNAPEKVAQGNKMLLENEQHNTIQPHYEDIKRDAYSARRFWFTRFAMRNIHPYHLRFIWQQPFGDVTVFADRWAWIDGERGMWQTWCALSVAERNRLVALDTAAIIKHRWQ
jgi:hypothetical protein